MKYSSAVTAQAHILPEQVVILMLVVLGKLHGMQKRNTQAEEQTNESVENEFDKMSVVSFEIVEEDVMEGGSASDGNTNKQQEKQPSENCSSTDVLEAAPTTNN
jgi:hypothetical protein